MVLKALVNIVTFSCNRSETLLVCWGNPGDQDIFEIMSKGSRDDLYVTEWKNNFSQVKPSVIVGISTFNRLNQTIWERNIPLIPWYRISVLHHKSYASLCMFSQSVCMLSSGFLLQCDSVSLRVNSGQIKELRLLLVRYWLKSRFSLCRDSVLQCLSSRWKQSPIWAVSPLISLTSWQFLRPLPLQHPSSPSASRTTICPLHSGFQDTEGNENGLPEKSIKALIFCGA